VPPDGTQAGFEAARLGSPLQEVGRKC
jgi:hypothetical protein